MRSWGEGERGEKGARVGPVGRLGGSGVVSLPEILILFHDMIFWAFDGDCDGGVGFGGVMMVVWSEGCADNLHRIVC